MGEPFYLPLHFNLTGRKCLFVGGGKVNERRILSVLPSGARVVVVSPSLTSTLQDLVAGDKIEWHSRTFLPGDLDGAFLVFVAIDGDPSSIVELARERGIPLNLASSGGDGDFIVPSVVREGDILISLSTSGRSPSFTKRLARWLREELRGVLFPEGDS